MKLEPWMVYLWGTIDAINGLLLAIGIVLLVAAFFLALAGFDTDIMLSDEDEREGAKKWMRRCMILSIPAWLAFTLMPNSKTLAIMVVAPAIVNSKPIQQDIPEIYAVAIDALKTKLKESGGIEK